MIVRIPGPRRDSITAGTLVRRQVSRTLLQPAVEFTEDKSLLESVFYFEIPAGRVLTFSFTN